MTDTEIIKKVLTDPKYNVTTDRDFNFNYCTRVQRIVTIIGADRGYYTELGSHEDDGQYFIKFGVMPHPRKQEAFVWMSPHSWFPEETTKAWYSNDKELIDFVKKLLNKFHDKHKQTLKEEAERRKEAEERLLLNRRRAVINRLRRQINEISVNSSNEDIVQNVLSSDKLTWDDARVSRWSSSRDTHIYVATKYSMSPYSPAVEVSLSVRFGDDNDEPKELEVHLVNSSDPSERLIIFVAATDELLSMFYKRVDEIERAMAAERQRKAKEKEEQDRANKEYHKRVLANMTKYVES